MFLGVLKPINNQSDVGVFLSTIKHSISCFVRVNRGIDTRVGGREGRGVSF